MGKRWKDVELRIAKLLEGQRAGAVGKEGPDVLHPILAPEIKTREKLPAWLTGAMQQAEDNAPEGKLPFIVLHEKGWNMEKSIVGMRLGVILEILRRINA